MKIILFVKNFIFPQKLFRRSTTEFWNPCRSFETEISKFFAPSPKQLPIQKFSNRNFYRKISLQVDWTFDISADVFRQNREQNFHWMSTNYHNLLNFSVFLISTFQWKRRKQFWQLCWKLFCHNVEKTFHQWWKKWSCNSIETLIFLELFLWTPGKKFWLTCRKLSREIQKIRL